MGGSANQISAVGDKLRRMNAKDLLEDVRSVLVIDWPSRDVPDSLVRAGFAVMVKGGPGPEDHNAFELVNGEVVSRRIGKSPDHVDLVYSHRPLGELAAIVASAKSLGAKAVWTQSGLSGAGISDPKGCWLPDDDRRSAENLVQAAGLDYLSQPYIGDVARQFVTAD